jgi:hypothetical protein
MKVITDPIVGRATDGAAKALVSGIRSRPLPYAETEPLGGKLPASSPDRDFDVVVIEAGPARTTAARRAAQLCASVAVLDAVRAWEAPTRARE